MPRADGEVVLTATLTRPGKITTAGITLGQKAQARGNAR
jgi:hypothetical protein